MTVRLKDVVDDAKVDAVLQTGNDGKPQDLAGSLEPFQAALARYEDMLWRAGARHK